MNNGTFCAAEQAPARPIIAKKTPRRPRRPLSRSGKTRPVQRKALQGATNLALRQKIAGSFQRAITAGDVLQIVFAFLHVSPVLACIAREARQSAQQQMPERALRVTARAAAGCRRAS
jgi:hypothetical protein